MGQLVVIPRLERGLSHLSAATRVDLQHNLLQGLAVSRLTHPLEQLLHLCLVQEARVILVQLLEPAIDVAGAHFQ